MERSNRVEWETDDMSLAAYLSVQLELDPDLEWSGRKCFYYFPESEELFAEVSKYISGKALVEPRNYNMTAGKLKKDMFSHPSCPHKNNKFIKAQR